jgi:WD40 repeat protein
LQAEGKATENINALVFSPDGRTLAISLADFSVHRSGLVVMRMSPLASRVELWDVQKGKRRSVLPGDMAFARSLAFTPDGTGLLTWAGDNSLTIINLQTGALRRIENPNGCHRLLRSRLTA